MKNKKVLIIGKNSLIGSNLYKFFTNKFRVMIDKFENIKNIRGYNQNFSNFDYIYILQPTSPLRDLIDTKNAIHWYEKSGYDSFSTISDITKNFLIFNKKKKLISLRKKKIFFLNGCLYGLKANSFFKRKYKKILYGSIGTYLTDSNQIDIDYDNDFLLAQKLYKLKLKK